MELTELNELGKRYAQAWCSGHPNAVPMLYSAAGSLAVNDDPPAVGRLAIAEVARGFMAALPDMNVAMDEVSPRSEGAVFRWTLSGTNTGPGGSGKRVRISGYEMWRFDRDGLIAESKGHFDAAEYERQLQYGVDA